ncbi:MAG TPA: hypothetical protein VNE40_03540 [Candidatus Dormibacteraeota bacterium]|nr:hypothetical protein [Candidatus Dormibacteraeota bacterium]
MEHDPSIENFKLPSLAASPADIQRLKRETESLDEYLAQAALRNSEQNSSKLPKTSRLLDELAQINSLNLLQTNSRQQLLAFLESVGQAPVLHISFATDPSSAFLNKIVIWLRQNIHPFVLVRIGLQPSIAAGCIVRTPNHYYDFSLRQHFTKQRSLLIQSLMGQAE